MSAQKLTSKIPTEGVRPLLITVAPANGSSEQFEARLNERQLCVSRTPFFAAGGRQTHSRRDEIRTEGPPLEAAFCSGRVAQDRPEGGWWG